LVGVELGGVLARSDADILRVELGCARISSGGHDVLARSFASATARSKISLARGPSYDGD